MKLILVAFPSLSLAASVSSERLHIAALSPEIIKNVLKKSGNFPFRRNDITVLLEDDGILKMSGDGCEWEFPYAEKPTKPLSEITGLVRDSFPGACLNLNNAWHENHRRETQKIYSVGVRTVCSPEIGRRSVYMDIATAPGANVVHYKHNTDEIKEEGLCALILAMRATVDNLLGISTIDAIGYHAEMERRAAAVAEMCAHAMDPEGNGILTFQRGNGCTLMLLTAPGGLKCDQAIAERFSAGRACMEASYSDIHNDVNAHGKVVVGDRDGDTLICKHSGKNFAKYEFEGEHANLIIRRMQENLLDESDRAFRDERTLYLLQGRIPAVMVDQFLCIQAMKVRQEGSIRLYRT